MFPFYDNVPILGGQGVGREGGSFWKYQKIFDFVVLSEKLMFGQTNLYSILYPLKTPEDKRFSSVFRGYKTRTLARYGLTVNDKLSNSHSSFIDDFNYPAPITFCQFVFQNKIMTIID